MSHVLDVSITAAVNLVSLTATSSTLKELNVSWTPGLRTGPTRYNVTWEEETVPCSQRSAEYTNDIWSECGATPEVAQTPKPVFPPWELAKPEYEHRYAEGASKKADSALATTLAREKIEQRFSQHLKIYTDGSVLDSGEVGCAFVIPDLGITRRYKLNAGLSIFSAEMYAILMACTFINDMPNPPLGAVILSDSKSSLQALERGGTRNRSDVQSEILFLAHQIITKGTALALMWLPSHSGIRGNELADRAARGATGDGMEAKLPQTLSEVKKSLKTVSPAMLAADVAQCFTVRDERQPKRQYQPTRCVRFLVRKPIKLRDFDAHIARLHKDANLLFQEEFEDIQENSPKHFTQDFALMDANKVKNRYVNILPFDHTRVKLNSDDDEEFSDFVNANYIPGYSSPREYIATQGPITCTIDDFWRMIWEQKSSIIVMLSDLAEKGRPKVDLYWPTEVNSPVQYGDIIVELTANSTLNKCTIRNFKILMENQEERKVTQYFIPGWEDYGANLSPDDLLDFIKMEKNNKNFTQKKFSSSAGVGRTGTFIALDFLMQFVDDHDLDAEVDIYNLKQYVFIHDALKLIIERKVRAMEEAENEGLYQNTGFQDNVYANQAFGQ
nr:hypothetical protein BaRGS_021614 [Batillaria attramentaria]